MINFKYCHLDNKTISEIIDSYRNMIANKNLTQETRKMSPRCIKLSFAKWRPDFLVLILEI